MLSDGEAIGPLPRRVRAMDIAVPVQKARNRMHAQMADPVGMLDSPFDMLCSQAHLPATPIGGTNRASCC